MIWVIVVLAVMNLATFLTVKYHKNQLVENEDAALPVQGTYEEASIKFSGRYFRDELDLSKEQMKRFSEFNPEFRQTVMAINRDMAEKRHNMLIEMAQKDCDTTRLNALSDSIGYLHANLKKQTYMYYFNFKNICNLPQQKKLEQLFGEMFNNDIHMGHNGRGGNRGQGGRRYGWRNKN